MSVAHVEGNVGNACTTVCLFFLFFPISRQPGAYIYIEYMYNALATACKIHDVLKCRQQQSITYTPSGIEASPFKHLVSGLSSIIGSATIYGLSGASITAAQYNFISTVKKYSRLGVGVSRSFATVASGCATVQLTPRTAQ